MTLNRSGFKRKTFERAPRPALVPVIGCRGVIRRVADVVRCAFPKQELERNEEYRRYVASHPCFACGVVGYSNAAHKNFDKGLGIKTSDLDCFPLCTLHWDFGRLITGCHELHDSLTGMTRDERRAREERYIERMHAKARADGRKEFNV